MTIYNNLISNCYSIISNPFKEKTQTAPEFQFAEFLTKNPLSGNALSTAQHAWVHLTEGENGLAPQDPSPMEQQIIAFFCQIEGNDLSSVKECFEAVRQSTPPNAQSNLYRILNTALYEIAETGKSSETIREFLRNEIVQLPASAKKTAPFKTSQMLMVESKRIFSPALKAIVYLGGILLGAAALAYMNSRAPANGLIQNPSNPPPPIPTQSVDDRLAKFDMPEALDSIAPPSPSQSPLMQSVDVRLAKFDLVGALELIKFKEEEFEEGFVRILDHLDEFETEEVKNSIIKTINLKQYNFSLLRDHSNFPSSILLRDKFMRNGDLQSALKVCLHKHEELKELVEEVKSRKEFEEAYQILDAYDENCPVSQYDGQKSVHKEISDIIIAKADWELLKPHFEMYRSLLKTRAELDPANPLFESLKKSNDFQIKIAKESIKLFNLAFFEALEEWEERVENGYFEEPETDLEDPFPALPPLFPTPSSPRIRK